VAAGVSEEAPPAPSEALRAFGSAPSSAATRSSIDKFGATDLFVVLPIRDIRSRHLAQFAPEQESAPLAA
jgi:hypothetical protein